MTSETEPTKPPGLTLKEIMVAIAVLAGGYAFLFQWLALILTVTMVGVLVLKGFRLPIITEGRGVRRWLPWVVWSSMLVVCPVAVVLLCVLFCDRDQTMIGPPPMGTARAWALHMVDVFAYVHVGLSVVAAVAVVVLTRGYRRWIAWTTIVFVGMVGFCMGVGAYDGIFGWSP